MARSFRGVGRLSLLAAVLGLACAHAGPAPRFAFFEATSAEDPWAVKVRAWQAAQRSAGLSPAPEGPAASALGNEYGRFSRKLRHDLVERVVRFVQLHGALYFRSDQGLDDWPTLREVIATGGDDCDGLDLLTFELLRDLGFRDGELYRAVLVHAKTRAHHMVTLWFDREAADDPYVLDPLGEVSRRVVRLSQVRGWRPLVLFDERSQFAVRPLRAGLD